MPLTNSQYESIIRSYEIKQNENQRILTARKAEIYQAIPEYEAIDMEISRFSVAQGRKLLLGDSGAVAALHDGLKDLSRRKASLLKEHGYPADYLSPVYSCPDCQDTGYISGEKCHCFKQQIITLLYEQSNIQEFLNSENFSTLSYAYYEGDDLTRFKNAVLTCRNFINNFNSDYHNLFFYGTVGTGKSFLSCCVAKELMDRGHSVLYFSSVSLFETLAKNSFDYKSKEELYNMFEDLYNCDLVIIDDLGTELTNNFVTTQFFSCLNERHMRKKATVISTNLTLEELRNRYSDRIFSRITSNYEVCKLTGPDIRMLKKRMLNRK